MTPRPNVNTQMIKDLNQQMIDFATQWSIMKNEWTDMKKKVEKSEAKQDESRVKIDRILQILENDDAIGQKGLVQEVHQNTAFRSKALTQIKMIALVASALISLVFAFLTKVIFK